MRRRPPPPLVPPLPAALLAALLWAAPLAGQSHALVPPSDPLYRDLGRLAAWGLVDTLLAGVRPYTRGQAAEAVARARRTLAGGGGGAAPGGVAVRVLERLERRLAPEVRAPEGSAPRGGISLAGGRLDATWTDSPTRRVPSNDVVLTEAVVNPLLAYDGGRPTLEGATLGLEVEARAPLAGGRGALAVRPRLQATRAADGVEDDHGVDLREAYLRLRLGGVAVTAGRAPVVWGHGLEGGLLLSKNPGPLTQLSASNQRPAGLPWILGALGPARWQVLVAELGREGRAHPHALLLNLRLSVQPRPGVEVGVGFLNQQGGEGAPGATVLERLADVLVLPDLLTRSDFQFSQKMAMADLRLRFPGARGLEVWVEGVADDVDLRRLGSMLWEDGGWVLGARLSTLAGGRLSLALEGQHTGVRFYGHRDFAGGVTLERRILGSELGMDGNGLYARMTWDPGRQDVLVLGAAWERRSNDRYRLVEDPPDLVRTEVLPKEVRWRVTGAWERGPERGRWALGVEAGLERVRRFDFRPGDTRVHGMARLVLEIRDGG